MDSKCTRNPYITKSTTMQQYKSIWSGAEFAIHSNYSVVLNITFTALLYGINMPIMWPLAALAIINWTVSERIAVAWLYKMPSSMDDKLTV